MEPNPNSNLDNVEDGDYTLVSHYTTSPRYMKL
jgi:hypothetical protein